jgi:hypothetical protein
MMGPDRRLTHDVPRPEVRQTEVKVTPPPPPKRFADDILEDDIGKIAYEDYPKKGGNKSQKVPQ